MRVQQDLVAGMNEQWEMLQGLIRMVKVMKPECKTGYARDVADDYLEQLQEELALVDATLNRAEAEQCVIVTII